MRRYSENNLARRVGTMVGMPDEAEKLALELEKGQHSPKEHQRDGNSTWLATSHEGK